MTDNQQIGRWAESLDEAFEDIWRLWWYHELRLMNSVA